MADAPPADLDRTFAAAHQLTEATKLLRRSAAGCTDAQEATKALTLYVASVRD